MSNESDKELALQLTPKEELAVIVERLKRRVAECQSQEVKIRLEVAADLIRAAIFRR